MAIYLRAFHHIGSELDLMESYVCTMRASLREAHEEMIERVQERAEGLPEEEATEVFNDSYEDHMCLGDLFPALSGTWTFVSITSFLEHQLVYICREVEHAKTAAITFKPRHGVLEECKKHMQAHGIPLPTRTKEWQEIKTFQAIRNVVVHRLGQLDEKGDSEHDPIHAYVERRDDAKTDPEGKLILTHEFCLAAIAVVRKFLDDVVDSIPRELFQKLMVARVR